jgi:GDP-L-fucose synthase
MSQESIYKNKKVLVAGGTGTIGIPVVRHLVERGAKVTVVSLDSAEFAASVLGPKVTFKRDDLTTQENCKKAVEGQQMVFNLVGIKGSVGIGETKVASYLVPMLRFQTNLMEAAFNEDVERFLFVGSVCSYPQADIHYEDNMWNGMPKQNDRIPGIAKRIGELLGEAYQLEYGWDAVRIVRPSNVYGPYDDFNPNTAQVIPALIHRMVNGENPVNVWGDGSAVRDFIFSEDIAYWILEAVEKAPAGLPLNMGSGNGVTIKEIADTIARAVSPSPEIYWDISKPSGDPRRTLAINRAIEIIGYDPQTSLEEGIRKTIDWYLKNSSS